MTREELERLANDAFAGTAIVGDGASSREQVEEGLRALVREHGHEVASFVWHRDGNVDVVLERATSEVINTIRVR